MKVRVSFTVDVDNEFRKALGARGGYGTLPTRAELKKWYEHNAVALDDDVWGEYQEKREREVLHESTH